MNAPSRPWLALAAALLFLPVLAAAPAAAGTCPRTYDSGSAEGHIYVSEGGEDRKYDSDSVTWFDGCGGHGCDDRVAGVYRASDGVARYFEVQETSKSHDDFCNVTCRIERANGVIEDKTSRDGYVDPYGRDGVGYHCLPWFYGTAVAVYPSVRIILGGVTA